MPTGEAGEAGRMYRPLSEQASILDPVDSPGSIGGIEG